MVSQERQHRPLLMRSKPDDKLDRAVIRPEHLGVDIGGDEPVIERLRGDEVVDAPSRILFARPKAV